MRIVMLVASAAAYFINSLIAKARYGNVDEMNYEAPLTSLVWITSLVSIAFYLHRVLDDYSDAGRRHLAMVEAGHNYFVWHASRSHHSRAGKGLHFHGIASRREVVRLREEGGASLGILSGFVAGNFSAYYIGLAMVVLMSVGYVISTLGLSGIMIAAPVFAFRPRGFRFLGMGPVTIAVDSYGPVTDNAQSVYELSLIEQVPGIQGELKKDYNIDVNFERAKTCSKPTTAPGTPSKPPPSRS